MSASARVRLEAAAAFVAGWPASTELIVVGATREAADDFCRGVAVARGATFGLHRFTLGQLASRIATATLAARGVTPATALAADALATRALFERRGPGRWPTWRRSPTAPACRGPSPRRWGSCARPVSRRSA